MVLGQLGRVGVLGGAAHRAGLPGLQLQGQQPGAVGVELPLQRGVLSLGRVQRSLRRGILLLALRGVAGGGLGMGQAGQQRCAGRRQALRLLDLVFQAHLLGIGAAQGFAASLGLGDGLADALAALFQFLLARLGQAQHLGGARLLLHQAGELLAAAGVLLAQFDGGVAAGDLILQLLDALLLLRLRGLVHSQQLAAQLGGGCGRKGVARVLHLLQVGGLLGPGGRLQAGHMQQDGVLAPAAGVLGLAGVLHGGLAQALVVGGVKDLPQNGGAVGRRRVEQPREIVLRQHRHLRELFGVDAQQLGHGRRDGRRTGDGFVRFLDKLGARRAFDGAAAALGGAQLFGPAAHGVAAPAVAEGQLDAGLGVGGGKVAAQHGGLAVFAGGLAVQRKGDGVKQRGLARAGVAADQKQTAAAKLRKVQLGTAGVGAKSGQGQAQGFHALAASSRRALTARVSSAVSGRPFMRVKKSWNSSAKGLPRTARAASPGAWAAPWGW